MRIYKGKNYTSLAIEYPDDVRNEAILIVSKIGHGKSLCSEHIAESYHNAGYLVISILDIKDNWESGFCMFKPEKRYHLEYLKRLRDIRGNPIEPSKKKAKLYHPFTFNFNKNKYPDVNFYTLALRSLRREDIQFLIEKTTETATMRLIMDAIKELKPSEDLFDFQSKLRKMPKRGDLDYTETTAKNIREALSYFKPFNTDFFLMPQNFEKNLNWKEILADQEHYHLFSTKFLQDTKMKYFITAHLINEIVANIDYAKHPICLIIEEIRRLTPFTSDRDYRKIMANNLRDNLSTMRNKGKGITEIMTTQVYMGTDQDVRDSASMTFLGAIESIQEINFISKALRYDPETTRQLSEMNDNCFLLKKKEHLGAIKVHLPTHCHAESDYNFEEMYAKYYPEKIRDYKDLMNEMRKIEREGRDNFYKRLKEDKEKQQKEKIKDAKEKSGENKAKEELKKIKEEIKEKKTDEKEDRDKRTLEIFAELKTSGEKVSYRKIANQMNGEGFKVSYVTVKNIIDNKRILSGKNSS